MVVNQYFSSKYMMSHMLAFYETPSWCKLQKNEFCVHKALKKTKKNWYWVESKNDLIINTKEII